MAPLVERRKGSGTTPGVHHDAAPAAERSLSEHSCLMGAMEGHLGAMAGHRLGAMAGHRHEDRISRRDRNSRFCRWYWARGPFHPKPGRLLPATVGRLRYRSLRTVPDI